MEETANKSGERKKYSINDGGKALTSFQSIANMAYIHSNQFANIVAATFKRAFADFNGCLFEVGQDGRPYMSFFFDHVSDEFRKEADRPCACEQVTSASKGGTDVISRMRYRDSQMKDGDRYYLTQDGIDIFSELVPDYHRNRNNKVDWKKYVSETCDPTITNQYDRSSWGRPRPQFTMVTFVDVNLLAKLIYGSYNQETDEIYDYEVLIRACLDAPTNPYNPYQNYSNRFHNYMLEIKQVPVHALQEVYKSIGIVQGSGLIRGDGVMV